MRVLVCGGRDFANEMLVTEALDNLHAHCGGVSVLIHGAATGADTFAAIWACHGQLAEKIKTLGFPANWKKYGKRAGPIRNERMLKEGKPDRLVAFPGGKGTDHMIAIAEAAGVPTWRVTDKWPPDNWIQHSTARKRLTLATE